MADANTDADDQYRKNLGEYRKHLVDAAQKAQEDFDKTVLSLSGAALSVSFVFLKDVVGPRAVVCPAFLVLAWTSWGLSMSAVLTSYFLSHLALRHAITHLDAGTIDPIKPGGEYATWTKFLNLAGAALFAVGVFCITFFAHLNLKTEGDLNDTTSASHAAAPTESAAARALAAETRTISRQAD